MRRHSGKEYRIQEVTYHAGHASPSPCTLANAFTSFVVFGLRAASAIIAGRAVSRLLRIPSVDYFVV